MSIRPKKGDNVKFTGWSSRPGEPPPPKGPWTGMVTKKISYSKFTIYHVRRDHDGKEVTMRSNDMQYLT